MTRVRGRIRAKVDDGPEIVIELRESGLHVRRLRARKRIHRLSPQQILDLCEGQLRLL